MKITQIEAIPVKVPYHEGIGEMMVERNLYQGNTVYKVHTDAGIVGIGEAEGQPNEELQQYVGRDPFEFMNGLAPTPLQQATYDIMGKALGVPVHQLVGDKVQDKVAIGYWSIDMPPEEWAEEAKRAYSLGYRLHKIKARPWHDIIEQVEAITEVVPSDYKLRIDPNDSFETPAKSIEVAKELRDYNIEAFESPIPQGDIEGYRTLKRELGYPLAHHMGNPEPIAALHSDVYDYFILGARVASTMRNAHICAARNKPFWMQLGTEATGISVLFMLHMAAAIPNATLAHVSLFLLLEHQLLQEPLKIENGQMIIPNKPGLGADLDLDAVERYRV